MTSVSPALLPASVKERFGAFLSADPRRLHVAAHSHHPWPDVTLEAHRQAWLDAARLQDDKWEHVFGEVMTEAQRHVAGRLALPDPATIAFAPNTHEFVRRLLSCLPERPRILSTDGEFHSFARQAARLAEAGRAEVERVAVEPFASFTERFSEAAAAGAFDLVYLSHVMFDSGFAVPDLEAVVAAVPDERTFVVLDGYHGFMALPTELSGVADRAFYLAGGYKYAMAGEGACFLHAPPGYGPRPVDTGWYAAFSGLTGAQDPERVPYPPDGRRFLGATFDPSGLYRFNAVQRLLDGLGIGVEAIHAHVAALQHEFLEKLAALAAAPFRPRDLVLPSSWPGERGHFLAFRVGAAVRLYEALHARGVVTDARGDVLRIGFGIYHDAADLAELCNRLSEAEPA
jgi:selenocysteine lyase/cysteine desulfurase